MEASNAVAGGVSHIPIYISSDEDDDVETQEAILLSICSSGAASASTSSPRTYVSTVGETPHDRKGKRKLQTEDRRSNSKKKPPRREHFDCAICFEKAEVTEKFLVNHCAHEFCKTCTGRYVAAKITENVAVIGCPDPACSKGLVQIDRCRGIIPSDLFDRWNVVLCEDVVGGDKFYCPFKDCSALLINDAPVEIRETECPHCHRLFCVSCRVPWHSGIKCEEFKKLGDDEKGQDDLKLRKLAKDRKWQRCPKCQMYVERIDGCPSIVCRCRHCFCYRCGSSMTNGYHRCKKC